MQFSTDSARMVRVDHGHEIVSGSGLVPEVVTSEFDIVHGRTYLAIGANGVGIHSALWLWLPKSFTAANPLLSLTSIAGVFPLSFPGSTASVVAAGPARVGGVETQRYSVRSAPVCGVTAGDIPKITIWVGPSGRLVQLREVQMISSPPQSRTTTVTTLRLRDFGVPVSVSVPKSTRGIKQGVSAVSIGKVAKTCRTGKSAWVG